MYARAEGREDADTVELEPIMLVCHVDGRFGLELKVRMVEFKKTAAYSYDDEDETPDLEEGFIGCIVFWRERKVYAFRFSAPMSVEGTIELHCKRSILINSDDGKMTTMLCGLGTAGSSFPCPRCTWQLHQNKLPM
jgi:hypothetical protein